MNAAQKKALFNLVGSFLAVALMGYFCYFILSGPTQAKLFWGRVVAATAAIVMPVVLILFAFILRKKQSPAEPAFDERDKLISKKAIQATLVSLCILLYVATAIPILWFGIDGSIPIVALPFINLGIFYMALIIYNGTVLVLYKAKKIKL